MAMDMNTDVKTNIFSSPGREFTPINSPEGKVALKQEQDQNADNLVTLPKPEEMEETKPSPAKATDYAKVNNTPRKRGRKPASNPMTPSKKSKITPGTSSETPSKSAGENAGTGTGTPTRATLPAIPTSLATAGLEDQMILRLRDEEKIPWAEITEKFKAATGIKVGGSTLRMRYNTMKANFVSVSEEDATRLLRIKKEVENRFEAEKWNRIAEAILQDGGVKYPSSALQKKFQELSKGCISTTTSSSASAPGSSSAPAAGVKWEEEEDQE